MNLGVVQAVIHLSGVTSGSRVRSRAAPSVMYCRQSGTETVCLRVIRSFPVATVLPILHPLLLLLLMVLAHITNHNDIEICETVNNERVN